MIRKTMRAPWVMVTWAFTFAAIFAVYYVRPYEEATGQDAFIEWTFLAAGPVIWTGTALFAWWMIRKSYS